MVVQKLVLVCNEWHGCMRPKVDDTTQTFHINCYWFRVDHAIVAKLCSGWLTRDLSQSLGCMSQGQVQSVIAFEKRKA